MGQSAAEDNSAASSPPARLEISVFPTELGWFLLAGRRGLVCRILVGHASAQEAQQALARQQPPREPPRLANWHPALRGRLQAYSAGEFADFNDIQLEEPPMTVFQARVTACARQIPFGQTVSYAQLAECAGFPRAARAVGSVMAANRFPIIVPCHRVVAAGGRLGGYSAPRGLHLKRRLLALEREARLLRPGGGQAPRR